MKGEGPTQEAQLRAWGKAQKELPGLNQVWGEEEAAATQLQPMVVEKESGPWVAIALCLIQ